MRILVALWGHINKPLSELNGRRGEQAVRLTKWTAEEDAKLTALWPVTPHAVILGHFGGRTLEALRKRARKLGLNKTHGASDEQTDEKTMLKKLEDMEKRLVNLEREQEQQRQHLENRRRYGTTDGDHSPYKG